jgi:hypothetical protein
VTPDGQPKARDPGTSAIEIELAITRADASANPTSPDDVNAATRAVWSIKPV